MGEPAEPADAFVVGEAGPAVGLRARCHAHVEAVAVHQAEAVFETGAEAEARGADPRLELELRTVAFEDADISDQGLEAGRGFEVARHGPDGIEGGLQDVLHQVDVGKASGQDVQPGDGVEPDLRPCVRAALIVPTSLRVTARSCGPPGREGGPCPVQARLDRASLHREELCRLGLAQPLEIA
jgi:hypothetical protein